MLASMSQPETPPPSPDHQAPLNLWRAVQALLNLLYNVFGAPEQLAARHTLMLKDHQLCAQWLRAAEALMRRMLFVEAALVSSPVLHGGGDRAAIGGGDTSAKPRTRQLIGFDADKPEAWRVSFRCFYGAPASRRLALCSESLAQAGETPPLHIVPRFRSAWPLAERMEALLRVVNNPAPYAKRLAARLRRSAELVTRVCDSSWTQFRDAIGHTLHDVLNDPLKHAAAVFRDSS